MTLEEEMRQHLLNARIWAHDDDIMEDEEGFSCIGSTLQALNQGDINLALERWHDLLQAPPLYCEYPPV